MFGVTVQGVAPSRPARLGRYELITRIGQGGMAEVQLALQRGPAGFEKLVVVKLVHDNLATQKAFVDMLLDEARVAALVKHPNVVDIYDLGQANGRFFIAMEYLEGEPLLAVLRAGREGKRLDPLSTGRLIADTAEGLDAAHELRSMSGERIELVHHDISLGNIVVLYNGQVKLVDFGVAKATQSAVVPGGKTKVQGKFSYMAPEKLKGAPGDRRSDIFSLGCVMWEALTLKRLFRGNNDAETMRQVLDLAIQPPSKVNGEVPAEYDPIVMRALDRDPNKRHLTAKELAVEIEELLRKRGYGAKNDKIARYMQDTFKPHIDARKKLVQEVVAKGSASAEVLDAAFNDPGLASGSMPSTPVPGEFARGTATGDGVPSHVDGVDDASHPTEISRSPFPVDTSLTPVADMAQTQVRLPPAPPPRKGLRAVLEDPRKRMMAIGIGGAVLVVLLVVIVAGLTRGKSTKDATPQQTEAWLETPGSGSATDPGSNAAAGSGSAEPEVVQVAGSGSANAGSGSAEAGSDEAEIVIDKHTTSGTGKHHGEHSERAEHTHHVTSAGSGSSSSPSPTSEGVEQLYQKGFAAYVRGDNQGALTALTKAKAANSRFPDTYRVLGFVYERMGEKSSAKVSYLRYLALKPNASDADQVRQRLAKIL